MKFHITKLASLFVFALTLIVTGCGDDNPTGGNGDEINIESISPTSGQVGAEVTITGTGFASSADGNTVTFSGDVNAEINSATENELVVVVPDGAQTGVITVEVDSESATSESFTVEESGNETPQVYQDLPGNKTLITEDVTWSEDQTLTGPHYVLPGATLTVEAGVTISFEYHDGNADDVGTIITLPGDADNFDSPQPSGRLVAEGTESSPVVFTSTRKEVASWGGIILAGEASNNVAGGQGEIEGLPGDVQYGADIDGGESFNDEDDSGILSYVQINYSGYSIADGSELQALTLYSVGSSTQIDHVSLFKSVDDGIELFGGTVDVKYLVSVDAEDDTFDYDQGWTGRGQFWVGVQTDGLPSNRGFENDGCADVANCSGGNGPTNPQIYNVTMWGNNTARDETIDGPLHLREGLHGEYGNIIVANFGKAQTSPIYIADDATSEGLGSDLTFGGNISYNNAVDGSNYEFYSDLGLQTMDPDFTDAASFDFSLAAGSGALTSGADIPNDDFFTQVNFSGAVGESGSEHDWTTGASWIKWED